MVENVQMESASGATHTADRRVVFVDTAVDYIEDESQNANHKRKHESKDFTFQLLERTQRRLVPLKQVCFTVDVSQGFADMIVHQKYENPLEQPLEIVFMMPKSETFTCQKIAIEFRLEDGTIEALETRVVERERAQQVYEDKVSSGETAIIATLPPLQTQLRQEVFKISMGNMPPKSSAYLRAFCNQKLESEDQSYCLRIPIAYVPAYLGPVSNLIGQREVQALAVEDPELYASVAHVLEVASMPVKTNASGLWDIEVLVKGQGSLQRVASLNHPVSVLLNNDKTDAVVTLKPSVNRSLVPSRDFVLYIRDEGISKPTAISSLTATGQQAVNLMMLPDSRSERVKERVRQDILSRKIAGAQIEDVDMAPDIEYGRTEAETEEHLAEQASLTQALEEQEAEQEDEGVKEYIFLIDRSGSMSGETIKLAREALILFLQSLPTGSKFNVCSYGSTFEFMFPERSVDYSDRNMQTAISRIATFEANLGGTEIYQPLAAIFRGTKPAECTDSHIFLLTDGAICDTQRVVNLVAEKCNFHQRLHTFGIGSGASEELIKQCASRGLGQFYFIYNGEEIEECVVAALCKTRLSYLILQKATLFDSNGLEIETPLKTTAQPLLEGNFVDLTCLLPSGVTAKSFRVEVLEPNKMTVQTFEGLVTPTAGTSLANFAVLQTFKAL